MVAGVANNQFPMKHCILKTGGKVVQNDDAFSGLAQLAHNVTADITSTARDKNGFFATHNMNVYFNSRK